ncbi:histidine kinase [Bradyrhizobium sacchari]|uniref:Diguanylate cyclase/phosphodiesterase with PAS/PAC and Chase sensor(S) n=1 Tax=Bradyrhizobium sacchari TaxID=1399419 RepID=A0A560JN80_9BRAD|nr:EAL domain-containing protein [Bradyrhizobium sacchari]OPY97981.1 histidine kinase [Bradyrhizobium sacchari]TWB59065.1 diguanylate cyclase/phosphodiesterase with PAS/PAC and Chase sensor(s) [Bradyrhizobium sacchari]TWB72575.1 diguanylate cyclase/phosphodiesterase with PAS/PAC and Chase sensor(s) [Bradyrhizobium sacchari]
MKRYRPHILVVIALAVVLSTGWHGALRNALTDLRFAWQSRAAGGNVVVVAIDAPSIDQIGVWPWPRRLHAELLRRLEAAGVQDVAFDVDFSTPSDPASDEAFVKALRDVGGSTILPSFKQSTSNGGAVHVNRPLKPFSNQSWPAVVNVAVESDGLVRRYPVSEKFGDALMPSMAVVLAGQDATRRPPFLIDFGIRAASIQRVSYVDVMRGDTAALDKLRDKKIIVGATALELGDRFSVPNGGIVSGPVLQALATESILQNRMLRWTSDVGMILGLGALCLLMLYSWRRFAPGLRVAILVATGAAVELIAVLVQARWPFVIDTSLLHIAIIAYLTAIALDEIDFRSLLGRIAESRFHRIAMSLGDGLVCTDADHRITVWNPGASAIFGYMPAEIIGRPFETLCAVPADGDARPSMGDAARRALLVPGGAVVVEFEGRRKNGETFPVEASFSGWQGTDGFQYGAILRDISVRKREAERVRYLAEHDALTGLANRNMLHAGLTGLIAAAEQRPSDVALLVLGLDGFQQINDMLGHSAGDLVLRAVADRLRTEVDGKAIVARLGGDEFAIALDCTEAGEPIAEFAGRIAGVFEAPLATGTRQHRVRISIGVAVYPDGGQNADDLLSNGHLALSRAKATRRGSHVIFESAIRQELENRLTLESELALAADRGEFELFYQPQVRLVDGSLVGAEALIRWRHPVRGYVSPGEFMPVVNTSALSDRIGNWVMETACRQARAWELSGNSVRVAINLSPSQLDSGDLAHSVAALLEATGLTPSLLELEVTEDILLHDERRVLDMFKRIQQLGVRVLFDDFGTGYASLSYLKKFPLDGLKIDRSFVLDLLTDSDDAAIVGSTIGLSKQLGLTVVAEGIENRATADFLVSMGCEEGQGYFFGRPMPVEAFEQQFQATGYDAVSAA